MPRWFSDATHKGLRIWCLFKRLRCVWMKIGTLQPDTHWLNKLSGPCQLRVETDMVFARKPYRFHLTNVHKNYWKWWNSWFPLYEQFYTAYIAKRPHLNMATIDNDKKKVEWELRQLLNEFFPQELSMRFFWCSFDIDHFNNIIGAGLLFSYVSPCMTMVFRLSYSTELFRTGLYCSLQKHISVPVTG